MAVTAADVARWGRFDTPTGDELTLLERIISAAEGKLSRLYYLSDPLTAEQEQAVILVSARLYKRRDTPEGRDAFGGEIAVTIDSEDADAVSLLEPRQGFA